MVFLNLAKQLIFPSKRLKFLLVLLILFLLIADDIIVDRTGGTAYSYLHLLYVPIVLAGFFFSVRGGLLVGIIAGLLMGPLMPTSYEYEITQPWFSWVLRMVLFTLVGALAGGAASIFSAYIRELDLKQKTNPLTGLPNLNGLLPTFTDLTKNKEQNFMVVVAELSHLERLDQTLGEEGTHTVIKDVAVVLKEAIQDQGILGQLQPHKFCILIPSEKHSEALLQKCQKALDQTFYVSDIPIYIEMRFGISLYSLDGQDLNTLIRKAMISLKAPTNQGKQITFFKKETDDSSERNLMILHKLKQVIENDALCIHYQPKINLKTKKVIGLEALTRWDDPIWGSISPEFFIPLIEETHLIHPLTQWLLKTVIHQMKEWKKKNLLVPVSVNFSVKNFYSPSLIETIEKLLQKHQIPASYLEVEVTETSIASSLETIEDVLKKLREQGVRITIDDFGTGQASQQYLMDLPVDSIKIDKIFVKSLLNKESATIITKNAISLGHDLGLEVVAEGIENQKEYDLLKEWGCDGAQGFFISKPLPVNKTTAWLEKHMINSDLGPIASDIGLYNKRNRKRHDRLHSIKDE